MILSFRLKDLFEFIVNDVFLNFSKPKICRIDIPVVLSFFLFSCLEITMRLEVHEPDIFGLNHVDSGVNGLLSAILIFVSTEPILEFLIFSLFRNVIVSIDGLSERLSFHKKGEYFLKDLYLDSLRSFLNLLTP